MKETLTIVAGWALAILLGYGGLTLVGFAVKVMYLAFMTGWRAL